MIGLCQFTGTVDIFTGTLDIYIRFDVDAVEVWCFSVMVFTAIIDYLMYIGVSYQC